YDIKGQVNNVLLYYCCRFYCMIVAIFTALVMPVLLYFLIPVTLEVLIAQQLGKKLPQSIPYWLAKSMALAGDLLGEKAPINSLKLSKITESLTFSNEKAKRELHWQPLNVLNNFKVE
ncbi:MAG: hypothetical protein ABFC18_08055, partial [Rikenellaceae bacterium]